ncbi:hypothetical protein MPH_04524 [Macrophomina phaseolina MS6]|uniref:Uncharacterized protein n=1 Tax=Macrophomina phaseolina (strain MS6) TaxID=1126212 RepID=K2R786_MACPH|nr:hypothetical protein MPH_04524 [Macrophomina phaseolina MS6]
MIFLKSKKPRFTIFEGNTTTTQKPPNSNPATTPESHLLPGEHAKPSGIPGIVDESIMFTVPFTPAMNHGHAVRDTEVHGSQQPVPTLSLRTRAVS